MKQHSDLSILLATGAIIAALATFITVAVAAIPHAEQGQVCGGVERWDAKVLIGTPICLQAVLDPAAQGCIDVWTVTPRTISQLASLPNPQIKGDEPRGIRPEEYSVVSIEGKFIVEKLEADQDAHLAVSDGIASMVTESVDPQCAKGSLVLDDLVLVRLALRKAVGGDLTNVSIKKLHGRAVKVTGVVFFDKESKAHNPNGSAPNGCELHPILRVDFIDTNHGVPLVK